jgi:tetratricopeptide (TPR) repeat protein
MRLATAFLLLLLPVAALAAKKPMHAPPGPALDTLFAQLQKASSAEEAKPIEEQIFAVFVQSGSPTVDLLMTRGAAALAGGDEDTAKKLFESVTDIAPNFAEGWHERAQLQASQDDDEGAMLSLQRTITLNPRQFAAMSQLGDLLESYGNKAGALKMYKRALALDPQLEGAARHARALERDVEGQGI